MLRRAHATEGDDALAIELNALLVDHADIRTQLLAAGTQLDADAGVTDTDYNANIAAALAANAQLTLVRGNLANGTELGDAVDLDGDRVYTARTDGALIREFNAAQAQVESIRAAFVVMLAQLDLDATVTDTDYEANNTVASLTSNQTVAGEQLAGEPAQLNAAGVRVHSSDADDGLLTEVEALVVDVALIRTNLIAALVQLDADGGVTDTDYEANNTPAAVTSFGTARTSAATLNAIPGATGPVVTPVPAGDPAL